MSTKPLTADEKLYQGWVRVSFPATIEILVRPTSTDDDLVALAAVELDRYRLAASDSEARVTVYRADGPFSISVEV